MRCGTRNLQKGIIPSKARYDELTEQIDRKEAESELFKGFIQVLEKQGTLTEEFDEGLWSSLVQEVVITSKDDI